MNNKRKHSWKRVLWTKEDKTFLAENYGKIPTVELAKRLNRTVDSIRANAVLLGVKIRNSVNFTKDEVDYLAENYGSMPNDIIAKEMNRTEASIEHKAMRLNLTIKKVAEWKYCIDCGEKLSRSSIYKDGASRCVPCSNKFNSDENHQNWKGGVSSLEGLVYVLLRPVWGKPIMERDDYTCQICGQRNGDKEVHHLRRLNLIRDEIMFDHPELSPVDPIDKKKLAILIVAEHKLEDGITLCKACHKDIHSEKQGELLGTPNVNDEDNQQPSLSNVVKIVDRKVQRLTGEDTTSNKPDTSALHTKSRNGVMI